MMNLYAFLFWDAYRFFYFKRRQKFKYLYCASVDLILLSTFAFLMDKQYKSPEWKKAIFLFRNFKSIFNDFNNEIYGIWVHFGADFKPSILKQDKGVWFSGFEMPENAVRQSLSAFQIVILLRMIPNSYAVRAVFRRKSRLLRIRSGVAVWWLKIKKFWQRCKQKLASSI